MRRADRLFAIVQSLRGRRLTTAQHLAEKLGVSVRSIYRDISELQRTGVPILGEVGVGYALDKSFDVPPIMFTSDELEALIIGARMVQSWGSESLSISADSAIEKIAAIVPASKRDTFDQTQVYVPDFHIDGSVRERFESLRQAIKLRLKVSIRYQDAAKASTQRHLRPLALHFWGDKWTLAAYCEAREAFRSFRLDRMQSVTLTDERFVEEVDNGWPAFKRAIEKEIAIAQKREIT